VQRYGSGQGELAIVVDCSDLERAADFWTQLLGYVRERDPDGQYQSLVPADGAGVEVLLQRVPEVKETKNRLHFDLRTPDLAVELARVRSLMATVTRRIP
jgi:predicted enzyme related to lactoylglutathione lyase